MVRYIVALMCATAVAAADWAVIVAGSNSYGNYRHQADACHAYQIVHQWGIPDSHVIVMQYDDIANSASNPFKGKVFNKPTAAGTPGKDVYAGCKRDYTKNHVSPANFLAVLTGDNTTTKGLPVLHSTANDRVFVNFVDHGGPGIIAFGDSVLSAEDLNAALKTMHTKGMFSKLVFYLEACESGSMFEGIIDPSINVYVTTAANADESSWGTYCPPDDNVNGKHMNTCLGDLYSVNWMQDCDATGPKETLEAQFNVVKKATNLSHVMQYGDLTFTSDPTGDFIGSTGAATKVEREAPNPAGIVNSRDIPLHLAYYSYARTEQYDVKARKAAGEALKAQIDSRLRADEIFLTLANAFGSSELISTKPAPPVLCGDCCKLVHAAMYKSCGGYDDYSLQYARTVYNICTLPKNKMDASQHALIATKLVSICTAVNASFQ